MGKITGSFSSSGPLHLTARRACERTAGAPDDRHIQAGSDAWIAIVFSAISVEAFLNEMPMVLGFATRAVRGDAARERLKSYQEMLEIDAVGSALTLRAKYILAAHAFSGVACDRGKSAYQHFDLLIQLRDHFVHSKPLDRILPATFELEPAAIVNRLASLNILTEDTKMSWMNRVATRAAALWACNAAATAVNTILDGLTDDGWAKMASFYRFDRADEPLSGAKNSGT